MAKAEMVRVNTRISKTLNEWLDQRTEETGVPKSTLIYLALENYMREQVMMTKMEEAKMLFSKMDEWKEMQHQNSSEGRSIDVE